MTVQEWITEVVSYFGPYDPGRPRIEERVRAYIEKVWKSDRQRERALDLALRMLSPYRRSPVAGQYAPPAIFDLEQISLEMSRNPVYPPALPAPETEERATKEEVVAACEEIKRLTEAKSMRRDSLGEVPGMVEVPDDVF